MCIPRIPPSFIIGQLVCLGIIREMQKLMQLTTHLYLLQQHRERRLHRPSSPIGKLKLQTSFERELTARRGIFHPTHFLFSCGYRPSHPNQTSLLIKTELVTSRLDSRCRKAVLDSFLPTAQVISMLSLLKLDTGNVSSPHYVRCRVQLFRSVSFLNLRFKRNHVS